MRTNANNGRKKLRLGSQGRDNVRKLLSLLQHVLQCILKIPDNSNIPTIGLLLMS